ncbi:hypothetical protein EA462_15255 [Natrarchaeobius halalkaliphilus]|uniref:DUF2795 domain-containing protein n=1 Tax=Natrarchaeobius halalkaliphilus TaxID=1679091 RepID=A0A3N6NUU9_9EURY|nr:hypothetical protein [Natrarchaeobius halalkaliphilus]RQG87000.1 hypothetical protein EA462_15255 [Natrarchaeobius halalkaliphilus]
MSERDPDRDRTQDRAERRASRRADRTESILEDVDRNLGEFEYPITSEELAAEYGSEPIDMPNETESLGSVFDRLAGEQYADPEAVREAVYGAITGESGDRNEANAERDLDRLDEGQQDSRGEDGRGPL